MMSSLEQISVIRPMNSADWCQNLTDRQKSIESMPKTTAVNAMIAKAGAANDRNLFPSNLHIATIDLCNMKDPNPSSDTVPTLAPERHITKFTDLPPELLLVICTHLLEDFIGSCPRAPPPQSRMEGVYFIDEPLMKVDLRKRDMSYFAAFQVNQSLRNACRVAFFPKIALAVRDSFAAVLDYQIRVEKEAIRRFDRDQRLIARRDKRDKRMASRLAELREKRRASRSQGHSLNNASAAGAERVIEERIERFRDKITVERAAKRVGDQYRHAYDEYNMMKQHKGCYKQWNEMEFCKRFGLFIEA